MTEHCLNMARKCVFTGETLVQFLFPYFSDFFAYKAFSTEAVKQRLHSYQV